MSGRLARPGRLCDLARLADQGAQLLAVGGRVLADPAPKGVFVGNQPITPLSKRHLPIASPTIDNAAVLEQLRRAAQDPQPVIRHLAAYALANVSGPDALAQLRVMLLDGDRFVQAVALCRLP